MAAPNITSPEQWIQRAMRLCDAAHMKYTQRYQGAEGDIESFAVPSEDRSTEYAVTYDNHTSRIFCSCPAGAHGRPCKHAGAVLYWRDARAAAQTTEACEGQARYDQYWEGIEVLYVGLRCDICGEESATCRNVAPANDLGDFYICADCDAALREEMEDCA